jgi:hypothetical protein
MKSKHGIRILFSAGIVVGIISVLFSSCAMYDPEPFGTMVINGKAIEIKTKEDTVTIAWDPPATPTTAYRIYYRRHGTVLWIQLDEIPATDNPQYVLHLADFGEGEFDFGVSSIDDADQESEIHTSLDITADPSSGWYLLWSY